MEEKFLTYQEQVELFKKRKMVIKDEEKARETLEKINYCKLMECSLPYLKNDEYVDGFTFEEMVEIFNLNKKLSLGILNLTEMVESSLKLQFAYVVGRYVGVLGHLDFFKWADTIEFDEEYIKNNEMELRKRILEKPKNNLINQYENFLDIPIWLIVEILTFGEISKLYRIAKSEYRKIIAKKYGLKAKEYISFLENVNLIRNLAAHNLIMLNMEMKTRPILIEEFKEKIHHIKIKKPLIPTNKIASAILILEYLVHRIDPNYEGEEIKEVLKALCKNKSDKEAHLLGFEKYSIIEEIRI